eukprot:3346596-Heterocapsa_arctica.AAC.1
MYKKHRLIQVHEANADLVPANGGSLAGCGFAVHYLKATIKVDVKEEGKELIYFVDDMVLFKESDNKSVEVEGIISDLDHTRKTQGHWTKTKRWERAIICSLRVYSETTQGTTY